MKKELEVRFYPMCFELCFHPMKAINAKMCPFCHLWHILENDPMMSMFGQAPWGTPSIDSSDEPIPSY
jgi:hypothetical protein